MQSALLVILSVLLTVFAFLFYIQKKKNIEIIAQTINFLMMQEAQQEQIKTDKDQFNEDFLKFISDSRDWAYTYIEDFQDSLNKFITDIEPEIAYFDEYGLVGDAYPHYHSMKKISLAYKELKKLLPEDYGKIDT
jgi:type II secretory pathway pseudopilin PulG